MRKKISKEDIEILFDAGKTNGNIRLSTIVTNTSNQEKILTSVSSSWATTNVLDSDKLNRIESTLSVPASHTWSLEPDKSMCYERSVMTRSEAKNTEYPPSTDTTLDPDDPTNKQYVPHIDSQSEYSDEFVAQFSVNFNSFYENVDFVFVPNELGTPISKSDYDLI